MKGKRIYQLYRSKFYLGCKYFLLLVLCCFSYSSVFSRTGRVDVCSILKAFLNDSLVSNELRLASSIDTPLFIIDNYRLIPGCDTFSTVYGRKVILDKKSRLNLDITDLSDSKEWKNYLWIRSINVCKNSYQINCYWKYWNKGGTVTYTVRRGKIYRTSYGLGTF